LVLNEGIDIKATGSVQLPHCHSLAKLASISATFDGLMEGVSPLTGYPSSITARHSSCAKALADTFNGFGQIAESTSDRNIVVWANEYSDRVQRDGRRSDGRWQCDQFQ
jgi:hypothetical protein